MGKRLDMFVLLLWIVAGICTIVTHQVTEITYGCTVGTIVALELENILFD